MSAAVLTTGAPASDTRHRDDTATANTDCEQQRVVHVVFEIALVAIIVLLTSLLLVFVYQFHQLKRQLTSQPVPAERRRLKDESQK